MKPTAEEHEKLTDYLLGMLGESETERLDELTVCDDDYADALLAAEGELVDSFVNGELTGERLTAFHRHFLATPLRKGKVEFARTLKESSEKSQAVSVSADRPGFFERLFGEFGFGLRLGFSAAALLLVFASLWVMLPRDGADLATAVRSDSGPIPVDGAVRTGSSGDPENKRTPELERLARDAESRSDRMPAPVRRAAPETGTNPARRALVASFVLAPPVRGAAPTLDLPKGAERVSLTLQLETDEFESYRAVVRETGTGRVVTESGRLRQSGKTPAIRLLIPARLLQPGFYTVEVSGNSAGNAPENIGDYSFRVVQ